MNRILTILLLCFASTSFAQSISIQVTAAGGDSKEAVAFLDNTDEYFEADANGLIVISNLSEGKHIVTVFMESFAPQTLETHTDLSPLLNVEMQPLENLLETVDIIDTKNSGTGHGYLKYIEVDGLYAAKKKRSDCT